MLSQQQVNYNTISNKLAILQRQAIVRLRFFRLSAPYLLRDACRELRKRPLPKCVLMRIAALVSDGAFNLAIACQFYAVEPLARAPLNLSFSGCNARKVPRFSLNDDCLVKGPV